ncbi:MAG TPA: RNA polymerase sigma-70 factor [Prolixibacteraceae bacterium]|nr:RNA polymerase sigma-70 factor [Prolixibacteraceae bacterium]
MQKFNNDQEALLQLAEGNLDAYRFLFDHHFSDLCNFLLIYLHRKELAEEIALDLFTYIWEKRQFLQIKVTFKSFLFAAAKNKAITLYRKEHQKIFTSIDDGESFMPNDSTSQFTLENTELRDLINDAILRLPEKSRQVFHLAWEENMSYNEIAIQLGLSPKTIENHVGIALRKLRESLLPHYKQIFMWLVVMQFLE